MFGFWKLGERRRTRERMDKLSTALEHVGVHPAERVMIDEGHYDVLLTAENVLLRQAEVIDAYRELVSDLTEQIMQHELQEWQDSFRDVVHQRDVAQHNLGYERQGRSADRIAYVEALRVAGREKGEITLCHDKAHRELNAVLDLLVARGLCLPVEEGVEVDLVTVVSDVLDRLGGAGPDRSTDAEAKQPGLSTDYVMCAVEQHRQIGGGFDASAAYRTYTRIADEVGMAPRRADEEWAGHPIWQRYKYIGKHVWLPRNG